MQFINKNLIRALTVSVWLLAAGTAHAAGTITGAAAGGSGGVGGGDASLAEQQAQTGLLTTIDADTGTIAGAVKAEDAAHSSGHTGIPFWGVRNDSGVSALSDANGDYTPIAVDSTGTNSFALRVKSGATTETLTGLALTTSGAYLSKVYPTDPNTSTAWTLSGVDALEAGGIETTAVLSRLMDVQVYVDYTPASASGGCRMMLCGVGQ